MMRVVHVIGPLRTGGAQTQLLGLVRAAHGRFWDATVVATSGGALSSEFRALGCPYIELRRRASPGLWRMETFRRIVSNGGFDVVHGNLWQSNAYARLAVVGRKRRRPAVVISERNVEAVRSRARLLVDRALAPVTDAYVGNTAAVSDFIRQVHPVGSALFETIANAVDVDIFHPVERSRSNGGIRVGAIGRLDPEKGFDVLIEAVRRMDRGRPIEVQIVGEGPSLTALQSAARGLPVDFLGARRPGSEVAAFLQQLDVFVLPSKFREGRPNALLEAIAVGLPVVATRLDGLDEILSPHVLVPPSDAEALASAIQAAADDPDGWRERSEAAAVRGFDELARDYLSLFERVSDEEGRKSRESLRR